MSSAGSYAFSRAIGLDESFDVIVVGGGPAGCTAAAAAAREGARTLLVEATGALGGMGTSGLVPAWCPFSDLDKIIYKGLAEKVFAAAKEGMAHVKSTDMDWVPIDPERLKRVYDDLVTEAGATVLFQTSLAAVDAEGGRVKALIFASKAGLRAYRAKVYIDCTGDADVAHFAGAVTMKETGSLSPSTLCLSVTNISAEQVRRAQLKDIGKRARRKYPLIPASWSLGPVAGGHAFFINHSGTRDLGQFDASDPFQFSDAECKSRRQALQMIQAMREFGGESLRFAELTGTGPQMGVRETRRVKGVYVLTEDDALSGRKFEDAVAWRSGYLDIGFVRLEKMRIHEVPYRALLPEKLEGLLSAGRCISATHVAASAGKSMGKCMATGHAAGIAAALAVEKKVSPRDVKVADIQRALRADGVDFNMGGKIQENVTMDRRT